MIVWLSRVTMTHSELPGTYRPNAGHRPPTLSLRRTIGQGVEAQPIYGRNQKADPTPHRLPLAQA